VDLPAPIHVEVEAPVDCVDVAGFFARVGARRPRAVLAREGEAAPTYRVTIVQEKERVRGSVVADEGEPRSLVGASCAEVADGLALTVALALDARAESAPPPATPAPAVPPPSSGTGEGERPLVDARPAPSARGFRGAAGIEAAITAMSELSLLPAPGIFFEAGTADGAERDIWVRIGAATAGGSIDTGAGRAELRWWVGQLETCPLRVSPAPSVVIRPCLGAEAGVLSAEGSGIGSASDSRTAWVAGRATGTLSLALGAGFFVLARAGVVVPVSRPRFLFDPGEVLFRPPAVAPLLGIGGGVTFP